jgi:hypothetical protein
LSDRLLQQGAMLYGVRFGPTTRYCVLDVTRAVPTTHARSLRLATVDRRLRSLRTGASRPLHRPATAAVSISTSPLTPQQKTWAIALAVSTLLENSGLQTSTRTAGSLSQLQSLCHQWRA